MGKNIWAVIIIILILIVLGAVVYTAGNKQPLQENYSATTSPSGTYQTNSPENSSPTSSAASVQINTGANVIATKTVSFAVTGGNFYFNPKDITVHQGDTVKVTFVNSGGTHDWKLEGYNVGTNLVGSGQSQTVTFVANQKGDFQYYCSVGTHRGMGMWGTLHVI